MEQPILSIENLKLAREGHEILRGVNLKIYPGQVHALLGLNGCGKSSLAYTIMGCEGYTPTSGKLIFDGKEITHLSISERARLGISLAWQEPARFEGIPIGKYVGLGMEQPNRDHVAELLDTLSLPSKIYGYRSVDRSLSGGERKRVELAAILGMNLRLAILDEPDSGIDTLSLSDIAMLIRRMAAKGSAVLLITHRDEMLDAADIASLMCAGTVLFTGAPLETRRYFATRCTPHLESLGAQPWDTRLPEVQEALQSNGIAIPNASEGSEK
ncbi:MAG: ATP-binding cassette domain-containing protein [Chloroflexota bacterium]